MRDERPVKLMVIRKLLRFHFSFWLHFKIMSLIIATSMKNQTASLILSAPYCNKNRVMIFFFNQFQLVGLWESVYLFGGKGSAECLNTSEK